MSYIIFARVEIVVASEYNIDMDIDTTDVNSTKYLLPFHRNLGNKYKTLPASPSGINDHEINYLASAFSEQLK